MGKGINIYTWLVTVLVTIGGLAWGVYGITAFMGEPFLLVNWIFRFDWLINSVYTLVGLAALTLIPAVLAMIWTSRRKR